MFLRQCARLRPPRATTLSTTAALRNEPADSKPKEQGEQGDDGLQAIVNLLEDQAKTTPAPIASQGKTRVATQYRPFIPNSFIRPHDLSLEGRRWRESHLTNYPGIGPAAAESRRIDVFHQLSVDPLKYALHPAVVSPFLTEMAKIIPRRLTNLTSKSQRRVAKAVKRAKMMGLIPLHSRATKHGLYW